MKKLKLRIANNVDTSRVFSASLKGGERGEGDCMALETHSNDVVPCVKTLMNFTVICEMERHMNEDKKTKVAMTLDGTYEHSNRVYDVDALAPTMQTCGGGNREPKIVEPKFRIRKLTPRECFRLMDVDDKDIDTIQAAGISDSQQYKLAGNSIVVNVLTEIFRKLLVDTQNDDRQLRMF